jgi:hypothetical protein
MRKVSRPCGPPRRAIPELLREGSIPRYILDAVEDMTYYFYS